MYSAFSHIKILYNSFILPHCTYGILSWSANVDKVLKLQKKAVRIITKSTYNLHTDPLFKTLGLLKIHDIYKCNVLKFFYQHCHGQLPFFLKISILNPDLIFTNIILDKRQICVLIKQELLQHKLLYVILHQK